MLNPNGARHGDALERGMGAARPTERPGAQPACRAGRSGAGEHLTGRLRAARGLGAGGHLLSARVAAPSRGAPCALPGWHLRRFPVLLGRRRGVHADLQHADRLVAGHDNDLQRCPQTPVSSRGWPPAAGLPPSHGAGAGRVPGTPPPARERGEPRAVLLLWLEFCSCSCSFAPLDAKATESSSQGCGEPRRGAVFLQLLPPPPCPVCPYLLVDRQRGLLGLHGFGVHGVPGEAGEGRGRWLTPSSCCKRGTPQFVPEPPGTAGPHAGSRTCPEENVPGGCGRVGVPPPEGLGLWG